MLQNHEYAGRKNNADDAWLQSPQNSLYIRILQHLFQQNHDEQNDEEYRQAHGREERQHADEPRRKTHYRPDVPDHAVDERAHLAFGLLLARNPHQQPAQQGQHQPEVVPARVLEIEDCAPDGERRQYGGVAPCQQRTARVADHAAAGVFDHAADQRQAFGGFEFTVFHGVIGFPKPLRRRV